MARDVKNLEVFQQADALFFRMVAISATLGRPGRFSLCDQLTRAALSVPVNLVEGSQRSTTRDYARFVEIAAGSAAETGYLLSVAARLAPRDVPLSALTVEYEASFDGSTPFTSACVRSISPNATQPGAPLPQVRPEPEAVSPEPALLSPEP